MRAINHALTGALIGLTFGEPIVAAPASLLSHIVCDIIPHHAAKGTDNDVLRSKAFRAALVLDAALCFSLVIMLLLLQPVHWLLAAICAFLAASPDFLFVNRFLTVQSSKAWRPSRLVKFLLDIQWFQRPIGAVVEVVWFIGAVTLLASFL